MPGFIKLFLFIAILLAASTYFWTDKTAEQMLLERVALIVSLIVPVAWALVDTLRILAKAIFRWRSRPF